MFEGDNESVIMLRSTSETTIILRNVVNMNIRIRQFVPFVWMQPQPTANHAKHATTNTNKQTHCLCNLSRTVRSSAVSALGG